MNCPNCGTENPAGARFCFHCGTELTAICGQCGTENPGEAQFCFHCGHPFPGQRQSQGSGPTPAPAAAPQKRLDQLIPEELAGKLEAARGRQPVTGERRIVTMLFCDVVGSTAAGEMLDPEEWTEIMNGAFETMIPPVFRYEGTVGRLMGDALLAFFGAPIAHEDDPRRAVLAGLDIVAGIGDYRQSVNRQWGIYFDVRVGINTGLVVVGAVGSDLMMEYTAMGDAINVAARMEQSAQPGTVQLAEETYKRVAPFFEMEFLGDTKVKGKQEPVPSYRVLGRKATPGRARGIEGLAAPLIGRDGERERLDLALANLQKGLGGVICLIGEAGLGKSRLIAEWHESAGAAVAWYETASLSYEQEQPYGLFQRLVRRLVGTTIEDSPATLRQKLATVSDVAFEAGSITASQVLGSLFGLEGETGDAPLSGETFKGLLFKLMRSLWRADAGEQPVVVVCDDLHWSDPASVELLIHLIALIEEAPLLLVCAFRPDRQSPAWQVKLVGETDYAYRYTEIALAPLSTQESDLLVNSLLHAANLPERLRGAILERSEGNPFYVEEVIRTLIEEGVVERDESGDGWRATGAGREIELPDNLQALIMARIDRLEEAARQTLQLAAVIGRTFNYRVLARLSEMVEELDRQLRALQRTQLVEEIARVPELQYIFRHALVQEAAYNTILLRRRRAFHRLVGEALETLYPERAAEDAPLLAHHFDQAQMVDRALKYYVIAGNNAFRLHAVKEAIGHYTRALALAGREESGATSEELKHLYLRLGRALELDNQYGAALANYEKMASVGRERQDQSLELHALAAAATVRATASDQSDLALAESLSQRALVLAKGVGDRPAEARILWNLMNVYRYTGRNEQALEAGQRSLAIARGGEMDREVRELMAFTLNDLVYVYQTVGDVAQATAMALEASQAWRELGNRPMLSDSLTSAAGLLSMQLDLQGALPLAEEALAVSQSIDNDWAHAYSLFTYVNIYSERMQVTPAMAVLEESLELAGRAGFVGGQVLVGVAKGRLLAELGALAPARAALELALAQAEAHLPFFRPAVVGQLARLELATGTADAADAAARLLGDLDDIPYPDLMNNFIREAAFCELRLARSQAAAAGDLAEEILDYLRAQNLRYYLPAFLLLQGRALVAQERLEAAGERLAEAKEINRAAGLRWGLWQILALAAEVAGLQGEREAAAGLRSEARAEIEYILEQTDSQVLRRSFRALPGIKRILRGEKGS